MSAARPAPLAAVLVAATGTFLVSLDVSIANAVLPDIGADFGDPSRTTLSWVISAYAIAFAAMLVPAGRVADRIGRRRTFVAGLALFGLGSLLCGIAPSLGVLLAGRVLQAAGAAAAQPASLGLLLATVGERERTPATSRWFGYGALGIGSGPILGGLLADGLDWRWAFLVNVPIVIAVGLATPSRFAETERVPGRSLPDPLGAAAFVLAAAALTLALTEVTTWGVLDARTLLALGGGTLVAAMFVARSRRVDDPLLDLDLLRGRRFALITTGTLLYSAAFFGLLFSFVLFLQSAWSLSIAMSGVAIVPMTATVFALSTRVGPLADRIDFRVPLTAGAALICAGLLLSVAVNDGTEFGAQWIVVGIVCGAGIGLCYPLLGSAAVDGVPAADLAAAAAVNQCARQLGAALGVAATVAAIGPAERAAASDFHGAWLAAAAFAALSAVACAGIGRSKVS